MNWIDRDYLQDCIDDGAVDPELIVVKIENEDKQPIGFIVNYANHNNSVGNLRRSADISGYIGELLRRIWRRCRYRISTRRLWKYKLG